MANGFRPYSPGQAFLLPPSPADWLPEDHLAYQVLDIVDELDQSAFLAAYSQDGRGAPAFSPTMMVALLLYAWCRHIYSSRKIAALCHEDIGARVIGADNFPDHRSINTFRLRHGKSLAALFEQSVSLCQRAGMVRLVNVAGDGSKVAANASKRKAMSYGMSYGRMVEEETRLQAEIQSGIKAGIDGYFQRAAEEDAAEDALYGKENTGPSLPEELRRRQSRLAKIREAKAALETEAQAAADAKQKEREAKEVQSEASTGRKLGGKKPKIDPTPKSTAQRSFTDPESRIMIMKAANGSFLQAYNGQAAVDADHQVIVACLLSQQAADVGHLPELVDQVIANTGFKPQTMLMDPGFFSEENVRALEALGIRVLIPPDRERCGTPARPAPALSNEELSALTMKERMRHQVSTEAGRKAYALRKTIVEPTFGQMKGCVGHPA